MKRKITLLLTALLLILPIENSFGKEGISLRIKSEPKSLDWNLNPVDTQLIHNLMEGLYGMTKNGSVVPVQAIKKPKNLGRGVYSIRLKPGLKWSDGKTVTVKDYVYSWNRMIQMGSPNTSLLSDIKEFKAVGYQWIEIKMKKGRKLNPKILTHWAMFPARKDLIEKDKEDWAHPDKMIFNGPYVVARYDRGKKITLRPNPRHRRPGTLRSIEGLIIPDTKAAYDMYKSGKLDFMSDLRNLDSTEIKERRDRHQLGASSLVYLGMDTSNSLLKSEKTRQALSWAISRNKIPKLLSSSDQPARTILPRNFRTKPKFFEKRPKKKVKKRISEKLASGLTLAYVNTPGNQKLAEFLQNQWRDKLEIEVTLTPLSREDFGEKLTSKPFPMFLSSYEPPINAKPYFYRLLESKHPMNFGKWKNRKYDRAVRKNNWYQAQDLLNRKMPIIPLYFKKYEYLMNPKLKDAAVNPLTALMLHRASLD